VDGQDSCVLFLRLCDIILCASSRNHPLHLSTFRYKFLFLMFSRVYFLDCCLFCLLIIYKCLLLMISRVYFLDGCLSYSSHFFRIFPFTVVRSLSNSKVCIAGYSRVRFRSESSAETTTETFQQTNSCRGYSHSSRFFHNNVRRYTICFWEIP